METKMTEFCKVDGEPIEVMAFKGTGFCSVNCRKEAGDDVPSVGTHMFVTTAEKRMIDGARNGEGQLGVVSIGKTKKKKAPERKPEPREPFICRCGHPGLGCICR
jgi:hypothetical protein